MPYLSPIAALALGLCLAFAATPSAADQLLPGERSTLYYKIGGAEPLSGAANPSATSFRIALGGVARLNYSCARFDGELAIANLLNTFKGFGTAIAAQVRAGIAALPLYVLQRAAPGMYELFQTYRKKGEVELATALKSCEEMEAVILQGGDPYEDWIKLAKGEGWKVEVNTNGDVVDAKSKVERSAGKNGVTWIGGVKRGGFAQAPIEVIRDMTQAGYNATMNLPPASNPTAVFPSSGPTATRLTRAFVTPKLAADWAVAVLGDNVIATCDEPGCPAKASHPGMGLLPKFEAERPGAQQQLDAVLLAKNAPSQADLDRASAPGVAITRELVDALRQMRPLERDVAKARLAMEIAQARVIDKALLIRNLLLTGAGVPEATYDAAQKQARAKVDEINRYIDDLLFETRVRREIVSTTANVVLEAHRTTRPRSDEATAQGRGDQDGLGQGRVR